MIINTPTVLGKFVLNVTGEVGNVTVVGIDVNGCAVDVDVSGHNEQVLLQKYFIGSS